MTWEVKGLLDKPEELTADSRHSTESKAWWCKQAYRLSAGGGGGGRLEALWSSPASQCSQLGGC